MDKKQIEKILKVDLFKELGLENLDEKTKTSVIEDAAFVIMRGAWLKIFEGLSKEKQDAFSVILEKKPEDTEKIIDFLKGEVPNFQDILEKEIAEYKAILLAK